MLPNPRVSAMLVAGVSAAFSFILFCQSYLTSPKKSNPDPDECRAIVSSEKVSLDQPTTIGNGSRPSHTLEIAPLIVPDEETTPAARLKSTRYSFDFHPTRQLWEKMVSATRDISIPENLRSINMDQWNLALNEYNIVCEPGLSKMIFERISSHEKGKILKAEDLVFHAADMQQQHRLYDAYVRMSPEDVLSIYQGGNEDEIFALLFSKIISCLLNNEGLDIESLLKEKFEISDDMTVGYLLSKLQLPDWEIRVQILEHLHKKMQRGELFLDLDNADEDDHAAVTLLSDCSHASPMALLSNWIAQFSDQRSQLVKFALSSFPDVMDFVLRCSEDFNLSVVFDGLFVPIRAKRSAKMQEWGHEYSTKVVSVVLNHFCEPNTMASLCNLTDLPPSDTDDSSRSYSSTSSEEIRLSIPPRVVELTVIFCRNIVENEKHERVRERCLSYLIQVIDFLSDYVALRHLFEDEVVSGGLVESLNMTLLDRKSEVRTEAFRLMKLLDSIHAKGFASVRESLQQCVLDRIDEQARSRYDRSGSKKKKRRKTKRRQKSDIALLRAKMRATQAAVEAPMSPLPLVRRDSY